MEQQQRTRNSGFASMDAGKQREIARKGGMAAHRKGTAHEFTSDEARNAGRKGGERVSANRSHMVEIGRLGGKRSAERRRVNASGAEGGNGEQGNRSGHATPQAESQRGESHRNDADRNSRHPGDENRNQNRNDQADLGAQESNRNEGANVDEFVDPSAIGGEASDQSQTHDGHRT